jgi:hypothetical protein
MDNNLRDNSNCRPGLGVHLHPFGSSLFLLSRHNRPRLVVGGSGSTAEKTVRDDDLRTSIVEAYRFIPTSGIDGVLPALPILGFSNELATAVEGTLVMAVRACFTFLTSTVFLGVFVMLTENGLFVLFAGFRASFSALAFGLAAVLATLTFAFEATLLVMLPFRLLLLLRRRRGIPSTSGYGRFRQRSCLCPACKAGIMAEAAIFPKFTLACVTHFETHTFGAVISFTTLFAFAFAFVSFSSFV